MLEGGGVASKQMKLLNKILSYFSSSIILEIYELMKEIGANFKFSDEELKSKIINF